MMLIVHTYGGNKKPNTGLYTKYTQSPCFFYYFLQNKRGLKPSVYLKFALGAIRTRDLSLKRGVLYLLSYKRKYFAIHFVNVFMLSGTYFDVNCFVKYFLGIYFYAPEYL